MYGMPAPYPAGPVLVPGPPIGRHAGRSRRPPPMMPLPPPRLVPVPHPPPPMPMMMGPPIPPPIYLSPPSRRRQPMAIPVLQPTYVPLPANSRPQMKQKNPQARKKGDWSWKQGDNNKSTPLDLRGFKSTKPSTKELENQVVVGDFDNESIHLDPEPRRGAEDVYATVQKQGNGRNRAVQRIENEDRTMSQSVDRKEHHIHHYYHHDYPPPPDQQRGHSGSSASEEGVMNLGFEEYPSKTSRPREDPYNFTSSLPAGQFPQGGFEIPRVRHYKKY